MLFEWTDEKIGLYVRASERTGFHRKLAGYVVPLLKAEDEVLDIGCGPGLLTLKVAPLVRSVTALDVDDRVLRFLAQKAAKAKLENITTAAADIADAEDLDCDVAVMCYFSCAEDTMTRIISVARRYTVVITHGAGASQKPSKISTMVRRPYAAEIEEFLRSGGYDYKRTDDKLDFGQPLKSEEEAYRFLDIYCKEESQSARTGKIAAQMKQLQSTGDENYPCLFPCMKDVAIFVIEGKK